MRKIVPLAVIFVLIPVFATVFAEYQLGDEGGLTWNQAESMCEQLGGYLATITSEAEQLEINEFMGSVWGRVWIGLHLVSGNWQWVTGETFSYINWAPDQPGGQGPVVFMFGTSEVDPPFEAGTWNDTDDIAEPSVENYLCEYDNDDDAPDDDESDDNVDDSETADDDNGDDDSSGCGC